VPNSSTSSSRSDKEYIIGRLIVDYVDMTKY
jgi:hypothetical protein